MTRILSELLGVRHPGFQQGLQQLERASGRPSEDIRLTTEIMHGMQDRVRQLGMDPRDTTGRELYHALVQRVGEDAAIFDGMIGASAGRELTTSVQQYIDKLALPKEVFALRAVSAKRLLRKTPPKRVMKQLGYRSLESMLKHEQVQLIFAAAHLVESATWHKTIMAAYKKLGPSDFESRRLTVSAPQGIKWQKLATAYVAHAKQNILGLREFGAVILLPLPATVPQGAPLAMTLLTLQAANDISTASTYLKMHQVRPDFGTVVAEISRGEPLTKARIIDGSFLPWKTVHRYFARHAEAYNPALFEPHVHRDDLHWRSAEDTLAELHPRFDFWKGASHLAAVTKHGTVSLNMADVLLSFCNRIPYEQRFVKYAREHVWHELLLRYMHQDNIEQAVHEQLGNELIDQTGVA